VTANPRQESTMPAFTLTIDAQHIAWLQFDLPNEKVNKFTAAVMLELNQVLADLATRKDLRALVITSGKTDVFVAGADLNEIRTITTSAEATPKARIGQDVFNRLAGLPFPSVAVIDGVCLGGGMEFALACTWRVVTDAEKTSLGLPEVGLGFLPGWGGTQRLPRLIGLPAALDLILSGRPLNGPKALRLGLADACFARAFLADELPGFLTTIASSEGRARLLARRRRPFRERALASALGRPLLFAGARKEVMRKTRGLMPAPLAILDVLRSTHGMELAAGLAIEAQAFGALAPTPESRCLVDCFFAGEALKKEGGKPQLTRIRSAGVLGAGVMGGGIAWLFSHHGLPVRLKDLGWDAVAKGHKTAADYNAQLVKLRKLTPGEANLRMHRIAGTIDYSGFADLDVVVEAVVEDLAIKRKVLAEVETHVRADTVLCSNTSSLSVTAMAEALRWKDRLVGMHFFNPVNRMPLVEVVPGAHTSTEAVAAICDLTRKLGKTAVVVKDCPGFLVNRILLPYMNEAAWLLQEGGEVVDIDRAIVRFGMPMGPFTLTDEVGIDVGFKVAKILAEGYGERMKVADVLGSVAHELKLLGRKAGAGFYVYGERGTSRYNGDVDAAITGVRQELNTRKRDVSTAEMVERCLLIMVNESSRCLEEGVVGSALSLDLAMVMGTGFPPQRGGPLHHADALGLAAVVERLNRLRDQHGMRFTPSRLLVDLAKEGRTFFGKTAWTQPASALSPARTGA